MKINAIAQIMKNSYSIRLCKGNGEQYITNGIALYSLHNFPFMNTDQLCAVLGISEKKKGKYNIEDNAEIPECVNANINQYNPLERKNLLISYLGELYEPLNLHTGIAFINSKYLKPFSDLEEISLYDHYDINTRQHTIIVKAGFLFVGAIAPENIISEKLYDLLQKTTELVKAVLDKQAYERRVSFLEKEQMFQIELSDKEVHHE